jgi:central glycolytic genes regulator
MKVANRNGDDRVKVDELSGMLRVVAPEVIEILESRYQILNIVNYLQPIGRRSLSTKLEMTERVIRKEANLLKDQGLLDFSLEGMTLTDQGERILNALKFFFHDLKGLKALEERLEILLNVKKVIIAPASPEDESSMTIKDIGRFGAEYVQSIIANSSIVGITGGSSVHSVIDCIKKEKSALSTLTVVPARGGLGKKADFQANTLVEKFANALGSQYKLLYTPDLLSKDAIDSLMNEPEIKEILEYIEKIDLLIFGIGDALTMAKRRSLNSEEIGIIETKGAVSEAFGYYFNREGEIVHEISTIGISLEKFKNIENLIAVAGGDDKSEAIVSICRLNPNLVLVTDENVARNIINIF